MLFNGNRRGEPLDAVNVGLIQNVHKAPCVGAHAFGVAPLAFGVKGIEGKRTFAGPRKPRDYRELVAGNIDVHIFQVVRACAADTDPVVCHSVSQCRNEKSGQKLSLKAQKERTY